MPNGALHGHIFPAKFTESGAHFLKVPKSFRARKAITKILNLMFTELLFSHNLNTDIVNFHAKFNAYTLLSFLDTDH